jgi:ubiquitin-conjugating enzyme E2 S
MAPAVIMSVAKELRKLSQEPLDGIKVMLNEEDVTDVAAEIRGPGARIPHRARPRQRVTAPPAAVGSAA